ncbi:hypothetical protein PInf_017767 [Phytophthora infestans]|nr:hypothetical protein PInf_017767 [Phytophthora infestans]
MAESENPYTTESSTLDVTAAHFAAATELSVSFEDEADIDPDAHDYDDYEAKKAGSRARRSDTGDGHAIIGTERPAQSLKNMTKVAEDSVSLLLSLGFENETNPSTMSLQDWRLRETGAAPQKWKKKFRNAFGAVGINSEKQPVSRPTVHDEDLSKPPLPQTPKQLDHTAPTKRGADRGVFGTTEDSPYFQDSHMVTPRSESRMRRMYADDEASFGRRGGERASKSVVGRCQVDREDLSSDDDFLVRTLEVEDPQAELMRRINELATLNDSDPTLRIEMASHRPLDRIKPFSGSRNRSENCMQWLRAFVYKTPGTHTKGAFHLSYVSGT